MTRERRRLTLLAARVASTLGHHEEATRLFAVLGISYVPSHALHS